jgi:cytochrome P450
MANPHSLAYLELRLIVAKTVLAFDMELLEESTNWIDQRTYTLWEKKPLMCKISPARENSGGSL